MDEDILKAIEVLKQGGVILYPTDTVWGLGCDATNCEAVAKIYEIKKRTDSKSMLVLVNSFDMVYNYIKEMPEMAEQLVELATKPLTIIYPEAFGLASNLVATDGSVGIRVCREKFCDGLIRKFRKPIVSTSANISGEVSPRNYQQISSEIKDKCNYIVRYRQDDSFESAPSSIIKLELNGVFKIIRE